MDKSVTSFGLAVLAALAFAGCAPKDDAVKVSSFGFDPIDSTRFIQAALDSGAKRVVLDRQPTPWISTQLYGRSNQEFIFEDGVELLAKRGEFKGLRDMLLNYVQCSNVVVRGMGEKGGTLRMWKKDYLDPKQYKIGDWRYTLDIRGCNNVLVENMNFIAAGGDGVCIAILRKDGQSIVPKNITLRKCVMDDNQRQGLTVGSGENLLIEDCVMKNTCGRPPQAGVDIEPDSNDERLVNIVFRRCRAENNGGSGFEHFGQQMDDTCPPVSIRFEDCVTSNNAQEIAMMYGGKRIRNFAKGNIHFSGCKFGNSRNRNSPLLNVWTSKRGFNVTFDQCIGADQLGTCHPISDAVCDMLGGDEAAMAPCTMPMASQVKVVDARPNELVATEPIEFLGGANLIFYARAGETARFRAHQLSLVAGRPESTKPMKICRLDDKGRATGQPTLIDPPGFKGGEFEFKAPTTAFYSLKLTCVGVRFVIDAASVATAIDLLGGPVELSGFSRAGKPFSLHAVNFDRREIIFAMQGNWYYKFAASIKDPAGKVVWERSLVDRPEATKLPYQAGVWRIDFAKAAQPHYEKVVVDLPNSQTMLFISSEKTLIPNS